MFNNANCKIYHYCHWIYEIDRYFLKSTNTILGLVNTYQESDNIVAFLDKPYEDTRCVEATAVSQNNFLVLFRHCNKKGFLGMLACYTKFFPNLVNTQKHFDVYFERTQNHFEI